jgi:2-polyprenyl-6-methoxyphenol hydroxylase-like FAD-dependent oxidoreductase
MGGGLRMAPWAGAAAGREVTTVSVTVMGGGVAGLSAALTLARGGHRVTLLERDLVEVGRPEDAPTWQRKGIPHFRQIHAFIPRGRAELKDHFADVYAALLRAGAHDVDLRRKIPGPAKPADESLQYLAVRRPLLEWALRRAVLDDPRIEVRDGVHVDGVVVERGRVSAVRVGGSSLPVDVLVDALGRRTPIAEWLGEQGVGSDPAETSDCKVVYYSRYYQLRPGVDLPDGPWFLAPRGDLGYLGYATFPGDNGTFAAVLQVPSGVPEWRALKDAAAFEAVVARIPALRLWIDPTGVDPITDVMPMAGLHNTIRSERVGAIVGMASVGDAFGATDPVLAHGLSFALIHAVELAAALREHHELAEAIAAYAAATKPALRERYDLATVLAGQRFRMWTGQPVDFTRHDGDYALFSVLAAGAAATVDPEVFRVFIRRIGLLDSTAVLDSDLDLQLRIERLFRDVRAANGSAVGTPPREELIAAASTAVG